MSLYSLHLSYPGSNFGNFVYISKHQLPFPVLWPERLLLLFSHSVMSNSSRPMDYSTPGFPAMHRLLGFARRIAQVLRLDYSADNPPQGSLDVLIPQTVDEGVQHRGNRPLHPWGRWDSWTEIYSKACSIKQTTNRWEPQVEKALYLPLDDETLRMEETIL